MRASGPAPARIEEHRVHVWTTSLEWDPAVLLELQATLSPDEQERVSRFALPRDREHFIAGRGFLRGILGRYTGRPAEDVQFSYGAHGKPRVQLRGSDPPVRFNVSHSHGVAVFAFAYGYEVGIDVEALRPMVGAEDIAARFFSPTELAEYLALPPEKRDEGFLVGWTRKEAYLKAVGTGLSISLESFSVSLTPGIAEVLISSDHRQWTLRSFWPSPGFVGAVVAEGRDRMFGYWEWPVTLP